MYIFIILGVLGSCAFYASAFYIIRFIKDQKGFNAEKDYKRLFWLAFTLTVIFGYFYIIPPIGIYDDEHAAIFWAGVFNAIIMGGLVRQES